VLRMTARSSLAVSTMLTLPPTAPEPEPEPEPQQQLQLERQHLPDAFAHSPNGSPIFDSPSDPEPDRIDDGDESDDEQLDGEIHMHLELEEPEDLIGAAARRAAEREEQETLRLYREERMNATSRDLARKDKQKRVPAGERKRADFMAGKSTCDARDEEGYGKAHSRWWWAPSCDPQSPHISLAIQRRPTIGDRLLSTYNAKQAHQEERNSPSAATEAAGAPGAAVTAPVDIRPDTAVQLGQTRLNTSKLDTLQYLRELQTASLERKHAHRRHAAALHWTKLRKKGTLGPLKGLEDLARNRGANLTGLAVLTRAPPGLKQTRSGSPQSPTVRGDGPEDLARTRGANSTGLAVLTRAPPGLKQTGLKQTRSGSPQSPTVRGNPLSVLRSKQPPMLTTRSMWVSMDSQDPRIK
jgi:hypothetical protein